MKAFIGRFTRGASADRLQPVASLYGVEESGLTSGKSIMTSAVTSGVRVPVLHVLGSILQVLCVVQKLNPRLLVYIPRNVQNDEIFTIS
jgi:hypothetical protein